ncbi:MAG TPA: malto-oligosyltrehalose synthase, partial [Nitrospira sp.]|nr:malto-oligosyltrehalose synthase [Nitrospira sp.]
MQPITHPRTPVSTYRIQMNRSSTFRDVARLVPYLHELGITDLYCSPYFTAVSGSMHGYDVVDPTTLNPEIGTEEDYRAMVDELHQRGMGQLLDVVPNHMGITQQINGWWQDMLENGPSSPYASFFDIDWDPLKPELRDKVLLPILGDQYGVVLENQELRLVYEDGHFLIRYYEHRLPIAPKPSSLILAYRLPTLIQEAGANSSQVMELESIITALKHLPSRQERAPESIAERYREKEIIKRRLASLVDGSTMIRLFLDENIRLFNGTKGDPRSFDLLDEVLNDQAYRLAYWRVAAEEINYRRFFDINELAAIRMEDPVVFEETHKLVFQLVKEGAVTGLRIDHVDGLYDPADYLNKLQRWAKKELQVSAESADRPLYVVVEKILGVNESLPANWPVSGTTGYEFLAWLNALFVDRANERALDTIYTRFVGKDEPFEALTYRCKQLIMQASMASELNVLGHQLNRLSERDRRSRDFTLNSLTHAIQEIIACFPVYRTYITGEADGVLNRDRVFLWQAVSHAKRRNPAVSGLVFDFVRDLLLTPSSHGEQDREERLKFVTKFQQTTSPVTAKGIEDTAFYRYQRFISLNEVGSDPQQFGIAPSLVHQQLKSRQEHWPGALSTTSTHDTKRSEDVRARLNVLSEIPKQWKEHVTRWQKTTRGFKTKAGGEAVPGRNEEYLLYQTLIGVWPLEVMNDEGYA